MSIPELIQDWKFFKEESADSTPLKDIKPVEPEPELEVERPGILKLLPRFSAIEYEPQNKTLMFHKKEYFRKRGKKIRKKTLRKKKEHFPAKTHIF